MRNCKKIWIVGALMAVMLVACGPFYPLGIPESQWLAMSNEQRLQAQQKQAELDRTAEERRMAEARARESESRVRESEARMREAEVMRQHQEMQNLRQRARYGDRLQCVIGSAEARIAGRWRNVEPVVLDLVRGSGMGFLVREPHERMQTEGSAVFDGQALYICRDFNGHRSPHNCSRSAGSFEDYRRGFTQRVDVHDFLRGNMRCNFAPGEGMPRFGGSTGR